MTTLHVVLLVGGILLFNGLIWFVVLRLVKKATLASIEKLKAELAASSEAPVRGPEPAAFRGSSHTVVKGAGVAALTGRRLIFRPLVGTPIEVARDQITALREDKWFLGSYTGGRLHTILKLKDGTEVGFFFEDPAAWIAALKP